MKPISRNQRCPCGSSKRFKQCCGQGNEHRKPLLLAEIPPIEASGEPALSVVIPYFRKLKEFKRVLPLNLPYFARPGIEVVLVLDENSEEVELLALLNDLRQVRWKVVVNDVPHSWRPPCAAINVGLRQASGRFVLVTSPESAFVGDVPAYALRVMHQHTNGIAIGRVGFSRFDDLRDGRSLELGFALTVPSKLYINNFYGSICAPKSAFESVRGYDESFTEGGGDDDNVRVRLEMRGYALVACPEMRILHLSFEPRSGTEHYRSENDFLKCTPTSPLANSNTEWGRDFARIAYVADVPLPGGSASSAPHPPTIYAPLPRGSAIKSGSRRQCKICRRLLHYDPPVMACAGCSSAPVASNQPNSSSVDHRQGSSN